MLYIICPECKGEGEILVEDEMEGMSPVTCPVCNGDQKILNEFDYETQIET